MLPVRLLCVGLDAVVLRDVRSCVPDADVHIARDADDLLQRLAAGVDVVVVGHAETAQVSAIVEDLDVAVLALVDRTSPTPGVRADVVLTRPVDRLALQDGLRSLLDPSPIATAGARLRRRIFDPATSWEPRRVFALLRLVVLAFVVLDLVGAGPVASTFLPLGEMTPWSVLAVCSVATVHALARVRWNSLGLGMASLDAVVWLGLLVWIGSFPSPFLLPLVLAVAQLGHLRRLAGAGVVSLVAGVLVLAALHTGDVADLVIVLPLLLLAGCLGAGIAAVVRGDAVGRRVLLEVQASLTGLHDHARRNPGRLEVGRVRRDAVLEVRRVLRADRVVLVDVAAADGLAFVEFGIEQRNDDEAHALGPRLATMLRSAASIEDPALRGLVGGGARVVGAPLLVGARSRGLLLGAWDGPEENLPRRGAQCRQLQELANDAALALDNAELFGAINELGARGERQHLARELHDGIIQSFVHVGFELERLARELADVDVPSALKAIDLRHVVRDAVAETRSIVSHLRDEAAEEGLDAAVRRWLQASPSSVGPPVHFDPSGCPWLPPEIVPDLLRVTQEAVTNARQHSQGSLVRVSARAQGNDFVLVVEDDGRGRVPGTTGANRGVGMRSMVERLDRLGGRLAVEAVQPTGTRVVATLPGLLATGVRT